MSSLLLPFLFISALLSLTSNTRAMPIIHQTKFQDTLALRPHKLIRRGDFNLITIHLDGGLGTSATSTSSTGSGTSSVGLFSSSASGESASNSTSSSSTSACVFLGGCTSSAAATCINAANSGTNTSSTTSGSSLCGSGSSTDSSPFLEGAGATLDVDFIEAMLRNSTGVDFEHGLIGALLRKVLGS